QRSIAQKRGKVFTWPVSANFGGGDVESKRNFLALEPKTALNCESRANTPAPLAHFLRGHEVVRADELGWQGLDNGALLDAAEKAGFDLLLTCDQNNRT
ncbi:MAG TPA: hypothetical protein VFA33_08095, partial [Bryobacteraceae bacterium]|nr:hypothetical protein [Bryobacteraceae bacterium]